MPYFFDILLVAVIAIFSIKHYKQGFAKTVLKFAKFFVSVILAILLGKLAAELIQSSQILDGLPAPIGSALSGIIGYVLAFAVSFAVLTLVIDLLCSVKIPVLHKLNELSRRICAEMPSAEQISAELSEISRSKGYPRWLICLCYSLIAGV